VKGAVAVAAQVLGAEQISAVEPEPGWVESMSEAEAERVAVPGLVELGAVASGNRLR